MILPVPLDTTFAVQELWAKRCQEWGLPAWRCDADGRVLREAGAGWWGALGAEVAGAVRGWAKEEIGAGAGPAMVSRVGAAWLVGVGTSGRRRGPREWLVTAIAAEPAGDAGAGALGPVDERGARAAGAVLALLVGEMSAREEDRRTIDGFTRQLTDGFETIDLLYALGRSMGDPSRPMAFVRTACERLAASMAFGYVAAHFGPGAGAALGEGERLLVCGPRPATPERVGGIAAALRAHVEGEAGSPIAKDPVSGAEVLVLPVLRAGFSIGALIAGDKGGDDPQVSSFDVRLLEAAAGFLGAFLDNAALYAEQRAMFLGSLRALTAAIDAKDRYTRGHSERVAHLSRRLAEAAGLGKSAGERLHICGLVHDVGKIGVPEAVLTKPGRLDEAEFEQIKQHPEIGYVILKDIPLLGDVLPAVRHHHERWDGRGYPAGLAGEAIPLYARIVGLADTFDAMSSSRAYRAAMSRDKVLEEIRRCGGTQHDPALVAPFLSIDFAEYDRMVAEHSGLTQAPAAAEARRAA